MLDPDKTHYAPVHDDYIGDTQLYPDWTTDIDPEWSDYDKTVARCQLANYGRIYLDVFESTHGIVCTPCDDTFETDDRFETDKTLAAIA